MTDRPFMRHVPFEESEVTVTVQSQVRTAGQINGQLAKTCTGFIAPDGNRTIITHLAAFCREHKLGIAHMHEVKRGKRKSYRGWIWQEEIEANG